MSKRVNKTGFVELYKGATLNIDLVKGIREDGPKYFVDDIYGGSWEVNRTRYHEIKNILGNKNGR